MCYRSPHMPFSTARPSQPPPTMRQPPTKVCCYWLALLLIQSNEGTVDSLVCLLVCLFVDSNLNHEMLLQLDCLKALLTLLRKLWDLIEIFQTFRLCNMCTLFVPGGCQEENKYWCLMPTKCINQLYRICRVCFTNIWTGVGPAGGLKYKGEGC